jgi:hypothetical protein
MYNSSYHTQVCKLVAVVEAVVVVVLMYRMMLRLRQIENSLG